jgi:hypothetical protein
MADDSDQVEDEMTLPSNPSISDETMLTHRASNATHDRQKKKISIRTSTYDNLLMQRLSCRDYRAIDDHTLNPVLFKACCICSIKIRISRFCHNKYFQFQNRLFLIQLEEILALINSIACTSKLCHRPFSRSSRISSC